MKKSGKILGVLLAVCMVITMNVVSAYADSSVPDTGWDNYAATEFAGGTGTKDDPYRIENGEQLAKLSKDVSKRNTYEGKYFRLEKDVDLSAHRWIPIGVYCGNSFNGFLDGNCKTISGMVVDQSKDTESASAGLFGYISNATAGNEVGVKDLTIANAALYVDESKMGGPAPFVSAGILVAGVMVNEGYKGTGVFKNISVSGTITVKATNGFNKIGGLIGDDNRSIVQNCVTDVTITGASNTGGMTGISSNTTFENCTAKGRISGLWGLGGFVGYATSSNWDDKTTESTFTNCIADVAIEASDWNVGGFVGLAEFGTFKNSASFGTVTSTVTGWEPRVGGFIGCAGNTEDYANSTVTLVNCHSASLVTCDKKDTCGGFAGKFVVGTTDGCSFDNQKNANLNGIGTNETEQQVEACITQKNLSNICEDVYGGHHYAEGLTVDQEATCSEEGSESYHCIRCDAKGKSFVIPKKEHSYSTEWSTDEASHWHECTECGAKTDEAEHTDTDKNHKCDVCEKVLSECADTNKDHKCDLCGKTLSEHFGGTADCQAPAICSLCGVSYGEKNPNVHANLTHVDAKAANEDEEGNIEYWYCADCGKYYSDAQATKEISFADTIVAKLSCSHANLTHVDAKAANEDEEGNIEYWYCAKCGKYFSDAQAAREITREQTIIAKQAGVHANLTHVDAKAATAESAGNIEYWHCEKCGKYFSDAKAAHEITLEQTVIEKLPGKEAINNLPKTGDDSRVALWLLLLAVSGGVLLKNLADRRKNAD